MTLVGSVGLEPALLGALVGLLWGGLADRIAARWPAKETGVRRVDWRSIVVVLAGGTALAALGLRFATEPATALVLGVYVLGLLLLLATDLDQRLLPDLVTLPLAVYAAFLGLSGANPFLDQLGLGGALVAGVVYPLLLYLLSVPFGRGALGLGDVKLLVSVGLLLGLGRGLVAILAGAVAAGAVIGLLLLARRISLRSYVPFGPFLIFGALWAILGPS